METGRMGLDAGTVADLKWERRYFLSVSGKRRNAVELKWKRCAI
jgi:hypothetical protein